MNSPLFGGLLSVRKYLNFYCDVMLPNYGVEYGVYSLARNIDSKQQVFYVVEYQ